MSDDLDTPETVRRLDSDEAQDLAGWCEVLDDLQTVLRCCEWLVEALGPPRDAPAPDDLLLEAVWTTALLSYGRCFGLRRFATLTAADLTATQPHGDVASWHALLLAARDHHTHPTVNPREVFAVGVVQGDDGMADGLTLSSVHRPPVDLLTVRQTGAIAYGLAELVDRRIGDQQRVVLAEVKGRSRADLDELELVPLVRG